MGGELSPLRLSLKYLNGKGGCGVVVVCGGNTIMKNHFSANWNLLNKLPVKDV